MVVLTGQWIYIFINLRKTLFDPFMEQGLGLNMMEFSIVLAMQGVASVFGTILIGWLSDRFSLKSVLGFSAMGIGVVSLAITWLPTMLGHYIGLIPNCILFAILFVLSECAAWPAVLKGVRVSVPENVQGTAFGVMEGGRGVLNLLGGSIALAVFGIFADAHFGILASMTVTSLLCFAVGLGVYIVMPPVRLATDESVGSTKVALSGLLDALKSPEIWLCGLTAMFAISFYRAFDTYMNPFMTKAINLPIILAGVIALFTGPVSKIVSGPLAGVLSDLKFKSSMHFMRLLMILLVFAGLALAIMPKNPSTAIVLVVVMVVVMCISYAIKALYFAPIGEMGIPKAKSAAAISVAGTFCYSPKLWVPLVFGPLLEYTPSLFPNGLTVFGIEYDPIDCAYSLMYLILTGLVVIGVICASILIPRVKWVKKGAAAAEAAEEEDKVLERSSSASE
jgi:predicted MFS family arabinose efflux permease